MDVCGICERIKSTPIPFSYQLFIRLFILLYVAILPFTVIDVYGYLTIPAVVLTSYILVGLEMIGEEIEDPFGLGTKRPATQSAIAVDPGQRPRYFADTPATRRKTSRQTGFHRCELVYRFYQAAVQVVNSFVLQLRLAQEIFGRYPAPNAVGADNNQHTGRGGVHLFGRGYRAKECLVRRY